MLIDRRDVAGAEPPVGAKHRPRRFLVLPVAFKQVGALHQHFAVVGKLQVDAFDNSADIAGPRKGAALAGNDAPRLLGLAVHLDDVDAVDLPERRGLGRQRGAAADHELQPVEAELVEDRPENQRPQHLVGGFPQSGRGAVPAAAYMLAREPHRQFVGAALDAAGIEHADQDVRGELLQIARHGEHHRRRNLEQSRCEILRVLAEMRHQLRHQRQRDGDIAAEHMAHRQIDDGAVRLLAQSRIVRDHSVGGGKMLAVADQRALRMTGGARRIDDEGGIRR